MTFFCENVKISETVLECRGILELERRKEYEKSSGIFDDINVKCF